MKLTTNLLLTLLVTVAFGFSSTQGQETPAALNFTMKSIEGEDVALSKYAGKVVVFVNVASKCGYTKQYKQLQELHETYADQGLAIVGIPCNQFRGQEPGTEEEILAFCQKNYGVEFDLMSKVDVNGENQTPLYKHLTSLDLAPKGNGPVKWNFEKIVVDKSGTPIARFATKVSPDSDEFVSVIKEALGVDAATPLAQVSKKNGKTYYLFSKDVPLKNSDKVSTLYYFAKDPNNSKGEPVAKVPDGKVVTEGKNGVPILKNKQ
jgi:glutathione peroxidase